MPSTTLPAAATGLPSRRNALASIAGLGAALSLPKAAKANGLGDPAVAELADLYGRSWARLTAACAAEGVAEDRMTRPAMPEVLWHRNSDFHYFYGFTGSQSHDGRWHYGTDADIAYLRARVMAHNENVPDEDPIPDVAGRRRRDEIVTAYDEWQAARKADEDASGYTASSAEHAAALAENLAIRTRIINLVSAAPEALRLKLQILVDDRADLNARESFDWQIARALRENGPWDDAIAMSIARDLAIAYGLAASEATIGGVA